MEQQMEKGLNGATKSVKSIIPGAANKVDSSFITGITETLEEKIDLLRGSTNEMIRKTEDLAKKHPFYVALGAAAVGAVCMGLLSRRFRSSKH